MVFKIAFRWTQYFDCEKNEIEKHYWEVDHKFSWDQKNAVDSESSLIPSNVSENKHSLKNSNYTGP